MKKILIVEDDVYFKDMITNYIEAMNMELEVSSATSVNGMILEFNKKTPDIIFLDVVLPGISGIELLKFLKQLNCSSKIYLMSGFSGMVKNSKVKPDGFLEKPFDLDKIGEILKVV